eukprot:CAMPEP_0114108550 /NCGR_PEP_ID=MMETSP0043_2-20121206/288_1 /TAXON_ID=464988 /ORGANISM="Hemiselmis andersenii, Strain CCMP644" /LENGTH=142 /DNA_ID=CAMNT_0001200339 /DNA_START=80 /DNA_END=505 /DNA_ORIENTATION=-
MTGTRWVLAVLLLFAATTSHPLCAASQECSGPTCAASSTTSAPPTISIVHPEKNGHLMEGEGWRGGEYLRATVEIQRFEGQVAVYLGSRIYFQTIQGGQNAHKLEVPYGDWESLEVALIDSDGFRLDTDASSDVSRFRLRCS